MMLRRSAFLLALAALATPVAFAQTPAKQPPAAPAAALGPGATVVKNANDSISKLLGQKVAPGSKEERDLAAKVTTSVRDFLDLDELGRLAMADHWDKLKPAEQKEFLDVLRALVEDQYIKGLRSQVTYTIAYKGESKKNNNVLVETEVTSTRKGRPFTIKIDYELENKGGKLRAIDMQTDGVGLVENYKSMFNRIMVKGGYAELIKKMKDKLAQQQKENGTAPTGAGAAKG
ncbi:MAG: ABC transporter substrate-binding protein [Deltaproteobacteria bacterium]|nr:ABC transporter substrate-binding protein [Deltaproteobacteria bacterium]MCW5805771.1 ABC transporter substrate-binding protein [Deltaproteobacteria bacterium]